MLCATQGGGNFTNLSCVGGDMVWYTYTYGIYGILRKKIKNFLKKIKNFVKLFKFEILTPCKIVE